VTTPGLSATGFVAAQTSDVQTSIQNDQLATIDPAINQSPTQPLGQMNGIWASGVGSWWSLAQALYGIIDPNNAQGVQLDNLVALTGVVRLSATKTLVLCTVNLNASQSYAPGQLTANITGLPQYTFVNRDALTSAAAGTYAAYFVATITGPIPVNAGTLTTITTTVAGWNSITNATNGTTGTNVETDTALRLRRASLIVASGSSTLDSIRTSLLNPALVPGIINATVLENNTLVPDSNAQPGKSFQALIWDGASPAASNTAIAQAIWNSKPSGILAFGATTANAVDSTGNAHAVSFTRVTAVRLGVVAVLVTNSLFPAGGDALVQAAMAAYVASLGPGSTVVALSLRAAALTVPGVVDVTSFAVDTNYSAPTNTANIAFTNFTIPTLATTDIAVSP
jgi:uncharacterized phage protein gp47/JayE